MGRRRKPTNDELRDSYIGILASLVEDSDKMIYISRASGMLSKTNGVILLMIVNNKIVNISKYVASICGMRCKSGITPIVAITKPMDIADFIRCTLQRELYRDVFIKHKLSIQWV
jgi:hypothetical protein